MKDLTAIMVTYQSADVIEDCLRNLEALELRRWIVVDNASADGSASRASAAGAEVISLPQNLGFGTAMNAGIRAARTKWVVLLNPDCRMTPEVLQAFRAAAKETEGALFVPDFQEEKRPRVSGLQPGYTRLKLWVDLLENNAWNAWWGRLCRCWPGFDDFRWQWPIGACLFVERHAFLSGGGFDERLFLYMEDVELGRQWCLRGLPILRLDAVVPHQGEGGSRLEYRQRRAILDAGRLRYARLRYGAGFERFLRFFSKHLQHLPPGFPSGGKSTLGSRP
jgi:N-acetylglucosaminyl-diphospho-decaprenol L-rhamnosyltransferase